MYIAMMISDFYGAGKICTTEKFNPGFFDIFEWNWVIS